MPGKIFVSYRRDDDPNGAARVRDGLAARFGKSGIFMDVDNLLAGQRFDEELAKALSQCDVLVAVMGRRWMELLNARRDGGKRDYVREEIAEALKRKVIVIPVRVGREGQLPPLPGEEDLPEDIRDLVLHQKHDVAHERFGRDIAELIEAITAVRRMRRPEMPGEWPWRRIAAGVAGLAVAGGVAWYVIGSDRDGVRPSASDTKPTWSDAAAKTKEDEAKAKADSEAKRLALLRGEDERQQRERAAAEAKKKADEETARKAEQEAQRLAALKAQEEQATKARLDAEAKRLAADQAANPVPLLRGLYVPPDPVAALTPGAGRSARDCWQDGGREVCGPEMVVVPAGSFTMGSSDGDADERPAHEVTIPRPFAVGKYEVTFAEWDACVVAGGCKHKPDDAKWGRGRRPVINVSWDDVTKEYLSWLKRATGKDYRLLSEAEWEYAARAGTTTPYSWGLEIGKSNANCDGCGSQWDKKQTAPVGSFKPNAFGLHDMHGNVWEWVRDCLHDSYSGAPSDGSAWITACAYGRAAFLRGGSWDDSPGSLRSANRSGYATYIRYNNFGFRVARTLTP